MKGLYARIEIPISSGANIAHIQRLQVGLQRNSFGLATDMSEVGKINFLSQSNSGIFVRNEF